MNGTLIVEFIPIPLPEMSVPFPGTTMLFPVSLDKIAGGNTTIASYPRNERVNRTVSMNKLGCQVFDYVCINNYAITHLFNLKGTSI